MWSFSAVERFSTAGAQMEAVLFAAGTPVSVKELSELTGLSQAAVAFEIGKLAEALSAQGHGIRLQELAGGWAMTSSDDAAEVLSRFRDMAQKQKIRLSKAAVETLAVIAYNQPVTRAEVEEIRGVRCEKVLETLLSHGIVRISGRRRGTGSPLLYRTTARFLETFGLSAISELPTLEELDEMVPGESQQEIPEE